MSEDPRLMAVARAHFKALCGYESSLLRDGDLKEAETFIARYDALRAYDAANPPPPQFPKIRPAGHVSALSAASWAIAELTKDGRSLNQTPLGDIATAAIEAAKAWEKSRLQPQPDVHDEWPYDVEPKAFGPLLESEVVPNSSESELHKSAAPLVGADPPWLEEAAEAAHIAWAAEKIHRNEATPYAVPYAALPESVKELDRITARAVHAVAARQPISEAELEATAVSLCCGDKHCNAVNAAAGHDISADNYARKYGCESDEKLREARAALEAARKARAGG